MPTHGFILSSRVLVRGALAAALAAVPAASATADVSETKTIVFDMGIAKINSTDTERMSGDKKRDDTETRCDGFLLSMICGDMQGGEIVRLDKSVTWQLEPKKKTYVEKPFPTPEQRAEMQQKMAEVMEKMKSCPAMTQQQPTAQDTKKCEMSPPKIDVKKTDETATFAGHEARRSTVTLTTSCTNKETGDSCDTILAFDTWLTQDDIPGTQEKREFTRTYMKKMGLDETMATIKPELQKFMAPYADAFKKAGAKAGDLKGYPLKTRISVAMGGEHCGAAKSHPQGSSPNVVGSAGDAAAAAAANSSAGAAGAAAGQAAGRSGGFGGAIAGSAAGAFAQKLAGGLFAKKSTTPAPTDAATPAAAPNTISLLQISFETTAINSDPIASEQFDIPPGWKLRPPKAEKEQKEFQCPKAGG